LLSEVFYDKKMWIWIRLIRGRQHWTYTQIQLYYYLNTNDVHDSTSYLINELLHRIFEAYLFNNLLVRCVIFAGGCYLFQQ